ncbi:MAG: sulfatase [bacterium]
MGKLPASCLVLLCLGCTTFTACSRDAGQSDPPNLILITMDTTRSDHCSFLGYEHDTTPNLRKLAGDGVIFTTCYAPAATTAPAHASLFTSQYPVSHRVVKNAIPLADDHLTLTEILATAGYQTAAVVSSFVLDAKFGLAQGFEFYDDDFDRNNATIRRDELEGQAVVNGFDRRAERTTRHVLHWLDRKRDRERPFFLFVHYFDPHDPYEPPTRWRDMFLPSAITGISRDPIISGYDGEIAYTDEEIGNLLALLQERDLLQNSLVVITADHGEGLGQHGSDFHGVNVHEEAVRVPLLFWWPGTIRRGVVFQEPVELIDLAPTICSLLQLRDPAGTFTGHDLSGNLREEKPLAGERPVFLHRRPYEPHDELGTWVDGEQFGIRLGRWKYIEGEAEGVRLLYDLISDPEELRDLSDQYPDRLENMASLLADWRRNHTGQDSVATDLSPEDRQKLRALGYVD